MALKVVGPDFSVNIKVKIAGENSKKKPKAHSARLVKQ